MFVYILSDFFNSFMCYFYMVPSLYDVLCVPVLQALTQDLYRVQNVLCDNQCCNKLEFSNSFRNDEAYLTVSLVNSEECSAMFVSVLMRGV